MRHVRRVVEDEYSEINKKLHEYAYRLVDDLKLNEHALDNAWNI